MKKVEDYLSEEAILEQCAEECSELAQACLKLARKLRGENPTPRSARDCLLDLNEEMADVTLCMNAIVNKGIISYESIDSVYTKKLDRWLSRLEDAYRKSDEDE